MTIVQEYAYQALDQTRGAVVKGTLEAGSEGAVATKLRAQGLQSRMLLQIHDELVLEVPQAELDTVSGLVRTHMEAAMELRVPLVANLRHGQSLDKE